MLDSGIRPFNLRSSVAVFQDSEPEPRIGADGNLFWPHPSSIDQKAGSGGLSSSIPSVLFPDHEELLLLESLIVRAQDRRKSNDQFQKHESVINLPWVSECILMLANKEKLRTSTQWFPCSAIERLRAWDTQVDWDEPQKRKLENVRLQRDTGSRWAETFPCGDLAYLRGESARTQKWSCT